ncbi:MAG: APC family permease [Jiangellaceae bacterium]
MTSDSRLSRRLGTGDAVVVGLGAMIGTGVFVVWQPAAAQAGRWLLVGLALAAFVAFCNATSTAQLAAVHPRAGGAYHYGRERLGSRWGALAGYAFLIGKLASSATAALAVGAYLWPEQQRLVAVGSVIAALTINLAGVEKTARATRFLLAFVLIVLVTLVTVGITGTAAPATRPDALDDVGAVGVLGSAAVLFYAFAGYARITVLGEEVRDPRSIPRAVVIGLSIALVLYSAVGWVVLDALGPDRTAASEQPLQAVARVVGADWLVPGVVAAAGVAAMGALLSLMAGVSRTAFAMAAEGDLPARLSAVHPSRKVPYAAEITAGAISCLFALTGDLVGTLSVSAFTVLVYYSIANAAALRLQPEERRWPGWLAVTGLVAGAALALSLPTSAIGIGAVTIVVAMLVRELVLRRGR